MEKTANSIPDNNPKPKKKERKKGYNLSAWSGRRQKDNGPLYDNNEFRFPLPPVGSYVVVRVRETFERGYGEENDVKGRWVPDDNCVDGWGVPLVYTVVGYTKGIEDHRKGNVCLLEARSKRNKDYINKKRLDVLRIGIGYYYLELRENDSQEGLTLRESVDESPVAEYTPRRRDGLLDEKRKERKNKGKTDEEEKKD